MTADAPYLCPYCKLPTEEPEYVDVGVGYQQVTARGCENCGGVQIGVLDDISELTTTEVALGWHVGDRKL